MTTMPRPSHLRRWGAVYILAVLWLGSWAGQLVAMGPAISHEGWTEFWSATFENWQSEYLQLVVQSVLLLACKHLLFAADAEDMERVERKLDRVLTHLEDGPAAR